MGGGGMDEFPVCLDSSYGLPAVKPVLLLLVEGPENEGDPKKGLVLPLSFFFFCSALA
jgi:hypothetical protein